MDPLAVAGRGGEVGGKIEGKPDPPILELRPDHRRDVRDDPLERKRFLVERQAPHVRQGELLEVLDEPRREVDLVLEGGQVLRGWLEDPVLEPLHRGAEDGDRGPQFVGDIGDHLPLGALRLLQALRHRVERLGELPQLVLPRLLHPGGEVARGDAVGCGRQVAQGASEVANEEQGEGEGDDRHHPRGDPQRAVHRLEERLVEGRARALLNGNDGPLAPVGQLDRGSPRRFGGGEDLPHEGGVLGEDDLSLRAHEEEARGAGAPLEEPSDPGEVVPMPRVAGDERPHPLIVGPPLALG